MQRVIGVLSGKGGVGKTVTSINLSAALHEFGQDTTVVDADMSSANLTIHLGLPESGNSVQDVLRGKTHIYKIIRVIPKGLKIVPASLSLEKSMVDMKGFKKVIKDGLGEITVIDGPPGFSKEVYYILESCDEVIIVTNPDVPAITDAIKMAEIAKGMKKEVLGIVVNRVENNDSEILVKEIESLFEVPVLAVIPEDKSVKKAIFKKSPVVFHSPHAKASIGYKRLAAKVAGIDYQAPSFLLFRRIFSH